MGTQALFRVVVVVFGQPGVLGFFVRVCVVVSVCVSRLFPFRVCISYPPGGVEGGGREEGRSISLGFPQSILRSCREGPAPRRTATTASLPLPPSPPPVHRISQGVYLGWVNGFCCCFCLNRGRKGGDVILDRDLLPQLGRGGGMLLDGLDIFGVQLQLVPFILSCFPRHRRCCLLSLDVVAGEVGGGGSPFARPRIGSRRASGSSRRVVAGGRGRARRAGAGVEQTWRAGCLGFDCVGAGFQ